MNCIKCNSELIRGKVSYICEDCGSKFSFEEIESANFSDWQKKVLETYPTTLAIPFQDMLRSDDPTAKIKLLIDTFTNVLKLLSLVVLTDYLRSDLRDPVINDKVDKLSHPLISYWNWFLSEAIPGLKKAGIKLSIPEIEIFYNAVEAKISEKDKVQLKNGYFDKEGDFVETEGRLGLLSSLISYRNSFAHGFNPPREAAEESYRFYYPILEKILEGMSFLTNYDFFANNDGEVVLLRGITPTISELTFKNLDPFRESIFLKPKDGDITPLSPLFITANTAIKNATEAQSGKAHHFVYENNSGKRILYVSPDGLPIETSVTIEYWQKLVLAKQRILRPMNAQDFDPEEYHNRLKDLSSKAVADLYTEKKLLKGIYLNRRLPEAKIKSFLVSPFPLAFVSARGGAGKSSLFGHITEELNSTHHMLLLKAGDIEEDDIRNYLVKETGLVASFFTEALPKAFKLVLLIDGLNERKNSEGFYQSVLSLAKSYPEQIKIITSYRLEPSSSLPEVEEAEVNKYFYPGGEESAKDKEGLEKIAIELSPLDALELKSMWALYTVDKKNFQPKFYLEDVEQKNRLFLDDLKNPLTLKIFLSTYHGKPIPKEISRSLLWNSYLNALDRARPGALEFLFTLSEILLKQKWHHADFDFLLMDERLGEQMRKTQIDSIWVQLLKDGVLTRKKETETTYLKITAEPLFDDLIGKVIIKEAPNFENISSYLSGENYSPAWKGLSVYFSHSLQRGSFDLYCEFIDSDLEDVAEIAGTALADFLLFEEGLDEKVETLFTQLLKNPSENDLKVVLEAIDILQKNFRLSLSYQIADYFVQKYPLKNWSYVRLLRVASEQADRPVDARVKILERAKELSKKLPENDKELTEMYNNIGDVLYSKGDYERSMEYFEKSLRIYFAVYGENHPDVAMSYTSIGAVLDSQGDYDNAMESYEKSLKIYLAVYGDNHLDVATSYNNIGLVLNSKGECDSAMEYFEKSLEIRKAAFGENHPDVAMSYNNIGVVLDSQGEYDRSMEYYEKSLKTYIEVFGENHPGVASINNNIGNIYDSQGEYDLALVYHEKSLKIKITIFGEQHPAVAMSYNNIGFVHDSKGEYDRATECYEKSLKIRIASFGENHPDVASSYNNLGMVLASQGKYSQALSYVEKSWTIMVAVYGKNHPNVGTTYRNIALVKSKLKSKPSRPKKTTKKSTQKVVKPAKKTSKKVKPLAKKKGKKK